MSPTTTNPHQRHTASCVVINNGLLCRDDNPLSSRKFGKEAVAQLSLAGSIVRWEGICILCLILLFKCLAAYWTKFATGVVMLMTGFMNFVFLLADFFILKEKKKTEDFLVIVFTCWLQWWPLWVDKSVLICVHKVKFSSDQLCRNLYLFVCEPIVLWTSGILLL